MVGQDVLNMVVYDGMGSFQCVFRGGRGEEGDSVQGRLLIVF